MLESRERNIPEISRSGMYWGSMLEIEEEVKKVEKQKQGHKEKEWWNVGNKTVDVTELVDKWKREDSRRKDILWAIGIVFKEWVKRDALQTTGPVHVGKVSTIIHISTRCWWVVNVTIAV